MTREEEIIETAKFIYSPSSGSPQSLSTRVGFIEGAKWADKTMIEKACKWLSDNMKCYAAFDFELVEDLRKAMEK